MRADEITLRQIRMRLRHPFRTSFGVTEERHVVLVSVRLGNTVGYGEVTAAEGPFFSHESFDTAWHVLSDYVIPWTVGRDLEGPEALPGILDPIRGHRMAKAGLENAWWDLSAKLEDRPLWRHLGGSRSEIECGVSIGIQDTVDVLLRKIGEAAEAGYRRVKVKIRPGWDVEVVGAIRERWPDLPLMADANSAYTLVDAPRLRELDAFGLTMLEQPLHWEDIIDHAALQKEIRTPICLDESIHSADDARKAVGIGACRIVNVKLGRLGGHTGARAVHDWCQAHEIPVWCGGMLETGIGRAHNVAMSGLENFRLPGDVSASRRYWETDVVDPEISVTEAGTISQSENAGIGYRVREDRLDELTERVRRFTP